MSAESLYRATVRSPVAPMHAEPAVSSPMVSQQLGGHLVEVLEERGDWLKASGLDRYEAWMHRGFLSRAPKASARQSRSAHRVSLGCVTRTAQVGRRALPLGAILSHDEVVVSGEVIDATRLAGRFPLNAASIAETAKTYFDGTSYLWGGVTPWGADCSGLVQSSFALHGKFLPRDAWQQAELGGIVETKGSFAGLAAGDLLFFSDGSDAKVTHVGISLGQSEMVHLSLGRGGYAIERLDDERDPYVAKLKSRFLFGRRLLG